MICFFLTLSAVLLPQTDSLASAPLQKQEQEQVSAPPARIQWFPTMEQGLAEAERTGRPILMTAAAPSCHGYAGMW